MAQTIASPSTQAFHLQYSWPRLPVAQSSSPPRPFLPPPGPSLPAAPHARLPFAACCSTTATGPGWSGTWASVATGSAAQASPRPTSVIAATRTRYRQPGLSKASVHDMPGHCSAGRGGGRTVARLQRRSRGGSRHARSAVTWPSTCRCLGHQTHRRGALTSCTATNESGLERAAALQAGLSSTKYPVTGRPPSDAGACRRWCGGARRP